MSFGFGVGDLLAVTKVALAVKGRLQDAPQQFHGLKADVDTFTEILRGAQVEAQQLPLSNSQRERLSRVLPYCNELLHDIQSTLDKCQDLDAFKRYKRWLKSLQFDLKQINEIRDSINVQIASLNNLFAQNIHADVSALLTTSQDRERRKLLAAISETDHAARKKDLLDRLRPASRSWLFASSEYADWLRTKGAVLFCKGMPGAGKTVATAAIANDLSHHFDAETITVCAFCSYKDPNANVVALLRGLLRACVHHLSTIPDQYYTTYDSANSQAITLAQVQLQIKEIFSTFTRVNILVDALDELPVNVDQSGYAYVPDLRGQFIDELLSLQESCRINLLVTFRDLPEIQQRFTGAPSLEIKASDDDIRQMLMDNLAKNPRFIARFPRIPPRELEESIITAITMASDGMFLLADLHFQSLLGKSTHKKLTTALGHLSTGSKAYDSVYETAMSRIAAQGVDEEILAMRALMIVGCARRLISPDELKYALSLEPDEEELDVNNIPDVSYVISLCAGLLTIDQQANVIRLVHKSADEYLARSKGRWFPRAEFQMASLCGRFKFIALQSDLLDDGQLQIPFVQYAKTSWNYHSRLANEQEGVSQDQVALPPDTSYSVVKALVKSLGNLEEVLVDACFQGELGVVELLLENRPDYDINSASAGNASIWHECIKLDMAQRSLGLDPNPEMHLTLDWEFLGDSDYDIDPVADSYSNQDSLSDVVFNSPLDDEDLPRCRAVLLTVAVARGNLEMVEMLLSRGAKSNSASAFGQRPLFIAAAAGYEALVSRLLTQGDIDVSLRSPFFCGALKTMVKTHGRYVENSDFQRCITRRFERWVVEAESSWNEDFACDREQMVFVTTWTALTALAAAAAKGRLRCLLLIAEKGDFEVQSRRSPMYLAAARGHPDVVDQLLRDPHADVDAVDKDSNMSPLQAALVEGKIEACRLLLSRSKLGDHGPYWQSVIRDAIRQKAYAFIPDLLQQPGVNLNAGIDEFGKTALHRAARTNDLALGTVLLSLDAIDVNAKDHEGVTPLYDAVSRQHFAMVQLLLGRQDIDINCQAVHGTTPIWLASESNNEALARILIGSRGLDANIPGLPVCFHIGMLGMREPPLFGAVTRGRVNVVRLLLDVSHIDVNWGDRLGRTALHEALGEEFGLWSALDTDEEISTWRRELVRDRDLIIGMLLNNESVDVNARDKGGYTPLCLAAQARNWKAVSMLCRFNELDMCSGPRDCFPLSYMGQSFPSCRKVLTDELVHKFVIVTKRVLEGLDQPMERNSDCLLRKLEGIDGKNDLDLLQERFETC